MTTIYTANKMGHLIEVYIMETDKYLYLSVEDMNDFVSWVESNKPVDEFLPLSECKTFNDDEYVVEDDKYIVDEEWDQ